MHCKIVNCIKNIFFRNFKNNKQNLQISQNCDVMEQFCNRNRTFNVIKKQRKIIILFLMHFFLLNYNNIRLFILEDLKWIYGFLTEYRFLTENRL